MVVCIQPGDHRVNNSIDIVIIGGIVLHHYSRFQPRSLWGSCCSIVGFLCVVVVFPIVLFRFTADDYPLWYLQTFLKNISFSCSFTSLNLSRRNTCNLKLLVRETTKLLSTSFPG
jgi:hypothetical protein